MTNKDPKKYFSILEELVIDNSQCVTYSWLSQYLSVSPDAAKRMLYDFSDKKKKAVKTIYLLSGTSTKSKIFETALVPTDQLTATEKLLSPLVSKHVYSVSPLQDAKPSDSTQFFSDLQTFQNCAGILLQPPVAAREWTRTYQTNVNSNNNNNNNNTSKAVATSSVKKESAPKTTKKEEPIKKEATPKKQVVAKSAPKKEPVKKEEATAKKSTAKQTSPAKEVSENVKKPSPKKETKRTAASKKKAAPASTKKQQTMTQMEQMFPSKRRQDEPQQSESPENAKAKKKSVKKAKVEEDDEEEEVQLDFDEVEQGGRTTRTKIREEPEEEEEEQEAQAPAPQKTKRKKKKKSLYDSDDMETEDLKENRRPENTLEKFGATEKTTQKTLVKETVTFEDESGFLVSKTVEKYIDVPVSEIKKANPAPAAPTSEKKTPAPAKKTASKKKQDTNSKQQNIMNYFGGKN